VIEHLRREERVPVHAFAYRQSCDCWSRRSLDFKALEETTGEAEALVLLRSCRAGVLLAGTSANTVDLEKVFVAAARKAGIPSVSVLDFWSNYRIRFSDGKDQLTFLPDRIAVMDTRARDEMVQAGFRAELLVVTGHPAFEEICGKRARFTTARSEEIRRRLGLGNECRMVLFVSQPLASLDLAGGQDPAYRGYTEKIVIPLLFKALRSIRARTGQRIVVVIRTHPREDVVALRKLLPEDEPMILETTSDAHELAMTADLVVGMNSIFLMEASCLGCIAVSVQPGLRGPDRLPSNLSGISIPVYREEDLEPVLDRLLNNAVVYRESLAGSMLYEGATGSVVSLLYEIMRIPRSVSGAER